LRGALKIIVRLWVIDPGSPVVQSLPHLLEGLCLFTAKANIAFNTSAKGGEVSEPLGEVNSVERAQGARLIECSLIALKAPAPTPLRVQIVDFLDQLIRGDQRPT
jgi:hypothetical protein